MNKYLKKVRPRNKYREFLRVLNGNLHLTEREIQVMSLLMQLDVEWQPVLEGEIKNINSTDIRKAVMKETRINKNNLTKYVKFLRDKGLLISNGEEGTIVNPMFIPKETGNKIEVLFTLDFSEDEKV